MLHTTWLFLIVVVVVVQDGNNALMIGAQNGKLEVVEYFVDVGVDPRITNKV